MPRAAELTIMALVTGESTMPPTPDPASAMDTARPRFSVNQFEMSTDTRRRVPATTTMPAMMHSTYSCHTAVINESPTSTTELVSTVAAPSTRALHLSVSRPMTSDANTATTVVMDTPVLNCPTVMPSSSTMCVWNSGMQFTNTV